MAWDEFTACMRAQGAEVEHLTMESIAPFKQAWSSMTPEIKAFLSTSLKYHSGYARAALAALGVGESEALVVAALGLGAAGVGLGLGALAECVEHCEHLLN